VKMPRVRFTMRRMMAAVALSAVAVWVGIHWSEWRESFYQWRVNRPIWRQLDQKVTLRYPNGVTFHELLAEAKRQTTNGASPARLTIYIDPISIQDAGLDRNSVLNIDVQSVPLKDALGPLLKPMGLMLYVHDGHVSVVAENEIPEERPGSGGPSAGPRPEF
jgi:hypothetical protein